MLDTPVFGRLLKDKGYNFASGVPCSFLKYLINHAINNMNYIGAVNEGDAVAIASGAYLGGQKSMVMMQNSGLTNAISPLTSLSYTFRIPVLGFVSLRGEEGLNDEPQHELTGKVTDKMLEVCNVAYDYLSDDIDTAEKQLDTADEAIKKNQPYFFIVRKNTFSEEKLNEQTIPQKTKNQFIQSKELPEKPSRLEALEIISRYKDEKTLIFASTGKGGRELFEIQDSPQHFYMVGSMGCIGPIGLGVALARPDIKAIAIDGDGALLMRMGSLATNGFYGPENLLHILIDNNCHDSTGGQKTVSQNTDFPAIASACGYSTSIEANTLEELEHHIEMWYKRPALTFIRINVQKGSKKNLGRPDIKPFQVKERMMTYISKRN